MNTDKEVFEKGRKHAGQVLNHGTELIEDITKILIDTADYSEEGQKSILPLPNKLLEDVPPSEETIIESVTFELDEKKKEADKSKETNIIDTDKSKQSLQANEVSNNDSQPLKDGQNSNSTKQKITDTGLSSSKSHVVSDAKTGNRSAFADTDSKMRKAVTTDNESLSSKRASAVDDNASPLNQLKKVGTDESNAGDKKTEALGTDDDAEYQSEYYNKFNKDFTNISKTAVGATKRTFMSDDIKTGSRMIKHSLGLVGAGTISRHAAIADFQTKMYNRDVRITENLNHILGPKTEIAGENVTMNRASVFIAKPTHAGFVDDFKHNKNVIDKYLEEHGINPDSLTSKRIENMLGKNTVRKYENGKLVPGSDGDHFIDGALYTDKSKHSVPITREIRDVLLEKNHQLKAEERMKQIRQDPGGVKNLAKTWADEFLKDTDAADGLRQIKSATSTLRATAVAAEGLGVAVAGTAVSAAELAGRLGANAGKLGAAAGNKAMLVGGKFYAQGDVLKLAKWDNKTAGLSNSLDRFSSQMDRFNAGAKAFGNNGRKITGQVGSKAVSFSKKNTFQRVRYVSNAIGRGSRWAVVNTVGKTPVGKTLGAGMSHVTNLKNRFKTGAANLKNFVFKHTKVIRAPFSIYNNIKRLIAKAISSLGMVVVVFMIVAVVALCVVNIVPMTFEAIFPVSFNSDESYSITHNVGQQTINAMLQTQTDFLKEVEDYMDRTCTLTDAEGNKLHSHHNAYFQMYMGDNTDDFENLSSTTVPTANTYTTSMGTTQDYSIETLYKTIISMSTVATGNEAEDVDFYKGYCTLLLNKILHTAKFFDHDGTVPITITDAGITDAMRLDEQAFQSSWCGEHFVKVDDGWMHTYGADSLEYSEYLRHSNNYNEWLGWNNENMISYDWAVTLWELDSEDWGDLGAILPGNIGGGDNGIAFKPTLVSNTVDKLKEQGYSELRVKAIEVALNEVGKHIYGVRSDSSYFPYTLDCSDFISGVLLAANVPGAQDATTGGMVKLYPHLNDGDEVVPGTIMVFKDTSGTVVNGQVQSDNHVVMYIGAVEGYGDYCVIECSDKTTYRNGEPYVKVDGVSVSGFTSFEQLRAKYPYRYYLNPYGD